MENYIKRITQPIHEFEKEIFPLLENINEKNIVDLLTALELAVSNGWVGEASEISDSLLNSEIAKKNPETLINIHLERMKKYQYFGLHNLATQTSQIVQELLATYSGKIETEKVYLWKFTAITQLGWIENSISKLENIIAEGEIILDKSSGKIHTIMEAFTTGLNGKKKLMTKSLKEGEILFSKSIKQLEELKYFGAVAHLRVNYAECIFKHFSREDSYKTALKILNENGLRKLKSHLVLRVYILLITSNPDNNKEKQKHILSIQMLMYAMGLGQCQKMYPLVNSALDLIPDDKKVNLFKINFEKWIYDVIDSMSSDDYEYLILKYYKEKGYDVRKLGDNCPVFDIIAKIDQDDREIVTLIQVKNRKSKVYKGDIPDSTEFEDIVSELKEEYKISSINFVEYYLTSGIIRDASKKLHRAVKTGIGTNVSLNISNNDRIVEYYLNNPEKMMDLFVDNY